MILPFLLALLAFGALLPIVLPLLRGNRPVAPGGSFDQAVYRDQLQELDRDLARGLITPADAEAARLEIQRRLLAADRLPAAAPRLSRSPVLAVVVFAVIASGSVGFYVWRGAPGLPDEPFASRDAEVAGANTPSSLQQGTLQQATGALAARLKQNPTDAAGWLLFARSLSQLSEWDQAEDAYRHAMDLGQTSPDVVADHAEAMVLRAGGTVTPAAEAAFRQVPAAGPGGAKAHYYLAVAAMQAGEPRQAIDGFQALLAELPADSPLRAQLGQKVAEAAHAAGIAVPELAKGTAAGPPPDTTAGGATAGGATAAAANMSDEQRQAMIRGMVARLAAKQEADPENLDGWLRLGQAYAVLQERDKAADAFERAARLRPDDASIPLQEARTLLSGQPPTEKIPQRVIGLLKRVEAADPDQPLVLWYLGVAAAQDRRVDEVRGYWGRLLGKLPPDGDDAKMVKSALEAVTRQ